MKPLLFLIFFSLLLWACTEDKTNRTIAIQPIGNFSDKDAQFALAEIQQINPNTVLLNPTALPSAAYYAPRNRYRADSLIRILKRTIGKDTVIIGVLNEDIGVTKNGVHDWGVMGLGFRPGNSCVVSTFRLSKTNLKSQLFKVMLHELGHTEGLEHCPEKTCLMRDAEGGNPLDKEKDFCTTCKKFLKRKAWVLGT